MAVAGIALPETASAQGCTSAQLAANPLVGMGYGAYARINNSAFNLSCYYSNIGGAIAFANAASVSVGSGNSAATAFINDVTFALPASATDPYDFQFLIGSSLRSNSVSPTDFVFAFVAPLTSSLYGNATSQLGITRASGNPTVSLVATGAASTVALGGVPGYLVANSSYFSSVGAGTVANPFAVNLGIDVGTSCPSSSSTCSFTPASSIPSGTYSGWGTVISYRQTHSLNTGSSVGANGEEIIEFAQISVTATPEPATMGLLFTGLIGIAGVTRVRRKNT